MERVGVAACPACTAVGPGQCSDGEVDELEDGVGQQPDETTQPAAMGLLLG